MYNNKENPFYTQLSKASDNQGQTKGILKKKTEEKDTQIRKNKRGI